MSFCKKLKHFSWLRSKQQQLNAFLELNQVLVGSKAHFMSHFFHDIFLIAYFNSWGYLTRIYNKPFCPDNKFGTYSKNTQLNLHPVDTQRPQALGSNQGLRAVWWQNQDYVTFRGFHAEFFSTTLYVLCPLLNVLFPLMYVFVCHSESIRPSREKGWSVEVSWGGYRRQYQGPC